MAVHLPLLTLGAVAAMLALAATVSACAQDIAAKASDILAPLEPDDLEALATFMAGR